MSTSIADKIKSVSNDKLGKMNSKMKEIFQRGKNTNRSVALFEDEGLNALLAHYDALEQVIGNLITYERDAIANVHKMCISNKDLSLFIHDQVSPHFSDGLNLNEAAEKFMMLQSSVANISLTELLNGVESGFTKPLLQERERGVTTKKMVDDARRIAAEYEELKSGLGELDKVEALHQRLVAQQEQLVEHLCTRNQERSIAIAKSVASLMEMQFNFYHSLSNQWTGISDALMPLVSRLNVAEVELAQQSTKAKPSQPSSITNNSTPVVPTVNQNPNPLTPTQKARMAIFDQVNAEPQPAKPSPAVPKASPPPPTPSPPQENLLFDFGEPSPAAPSPVAPASQSEHTFDFFQTQETPLVPSQTSQDPFGAFGTTSTVPKSNSIFDELDSLGTSQGNKPKPASNSNRIDAFAFFASTSQSSPKVQPSQQSPKPQAAQQASQAQKNLMSMDEDWMNSPSSSNAPRHYVPPATTEEKLANLRNIEEEHKREQDARVQYDAVLTTKIEGWVAGKRGNLRALLSTLQVVLWEDASWQPVSLGDLLTPQKLKITYMKALRIVHPDKMANEAVERRLLAERVFDLLQEAQKKENF